MTDPTRDFVPGVYAHWKGNRYFAACLAADSEDRDAAPQVVYYSEEKRCWWRRPLGMFLEDVPPERLAAWRFTLVAELRDGRLLAPGGALTRDDFTRYGRLVQDAVRSLGLAPPPLGD